MKVGAGGGICREDAARAGGRGPGAVMRCAMAEMFAAPPMFLQPPPGGRRKEGEAMRKMERARRGPEPGRAHGR